MIASYEYLWPKGDHIDRSVSQSFRSLENVSLRKLANLKVLFLNVIDNISGGISAIWLRDGGGHIELRSLYMNIRS